MAAPTGCGAACSSFATAANQGRSWPHHGEPRDLGAALANAPSVTIELVVTATTRELPKACSSGVIEVGFMPTDDERRKRLEFQPARFSNQEYVSRRRLRR
jgi:hypothetical protein